MSGKSEPRLSDYFGYGRLLRFVIPSVAMLLFTSVYGVVDGLFVSNFVGKTPFAAINLIMPFLIILGSVGFMLGAGGSAIVAKTMGMGDGELAKRYFSTVIYTTFALGVLIGAFGIAFSESIARFLGAEGELLAGSVLYSRTILIALPGYMLQNVFQSFCVTAEKPGFGLVIMVAAGLTNIFLDFLTFFVPKNY